MVEVPPTPGTLPPVTRGDLDLKAELAHFTTLLVPGNPVDPIIRQFVRVMKAWIQAQESTSSNTQILLLQDILKVLLHIDSSLTQLNFRIPRLTDVSGVLIDGD